MAESVNFELVSPERLVLSTLARSVTVPGAAGYFTVMGSHAPLLTTIRPGFVTVIDTRDVADVYFVSGGFADVSPAGMTILADEARPAADFSRTEIEMLIAAGLTAQEAAATPDERSRVQHELDQWRNLLFDSAIRREATS